jgi:hypothetical protein
LLNASTSARTINRLINLDETRSSISFDLFNELLNIADTDTITRIVNFRMGTSLDTKEVVEAAIRSNLPTSSLDWSESDWSYYRTTWHAIRSSGAFADGGLHPGGLRLVGERGPELEVTGPSRIMSNEDLMKALQPQPDIQVAPPINLIQAEAGSDPELLAALEELQTELHELRMEQRKQHNASHRELKELREIEEKREVIGQPKIREDA